MAKSSMRPRGCRTLARLTTRNAAERDLLALHRSLTPQMQTALLAWGKFCHMLGAAPRPEMLAIRRRAAVRKGGAQ